MEQHSLHSPQWKDSVLAGSRWERDLAMAGARQLSRKVTATVAAVVVAGASLAAASPASARNWGSTACGGSPFNCVSLANNSVHAINFNGSFGGNGLTDIPYMDDSVRYALAHAYNPTNMTAYHDQSDPYPDVIAADYDWGYSNGAVAYVLCPVEAAEGGNRAGGSGWCRGQIMRFNRYYYANYNGYYDTGRQRDQISCHELGHTVGLRHRETLNSCMYHTAGSGAALTLDSHDLTYHINDHY